jgi:hypothetical protein
VRWFKGFFLHIRGKYIPMKKPLLFAACTAACLCANAQVPADLPSGCVAWFPFTNALTDATDNSTGLTLNGDAVYVNDRAGNPASALYFYESLPETSYVSGYVEGQNDQLPFGSEPRTIAGWYNAEFVPQTSHTSIMAWGSGSADPLTIGEACAFFAGKNGDQIWFWSAWNDVGQTTSFGDGQWYHFAMTFDGGNIVKFYKDGSYLGQQILTDPVNTVVNSNIFYISKSTHATDLGEFEGHFTGALDDIGVWNRVLSDAEVEQVFESTAQSASIAENAWNTINIYPNPANNELTVSGSQNTAITVVSVTGSVMSTIELNGTAAIDVSTYAPGVYFVRTAEGQTKKFIKE